MFLNYIKEFFIKKSLRKNLQAQQYKVFSKEMKTIGLLVDESKFKNSEELNAEIILQGIASENIKVMSYRSRISKKETYFFPVFGKKDISWNGKIINSDLADFIATEFDILISYYDGNTAYLELVTSLSKAKFKVGFTMENSANRLMINTNIENYKLFIAELFKCLKNIN
jgi:hypothetical protein